MARLRVFSKYLVAYLQRLLIQQSKQIQKSKEFSHLHNCLGKVLAARLQTLQVWLSMREDHVICWNQSFGVVALHGRYSSSKANSSTTMLKMIRGDWYKLVETEPKVDKFVAVWLGAEDSWGSFGGLLGVEHFVVAATVRSAYLLFSPKNRWQISILTAIKYFRPSFTQDSQNDTCALILAPSKGAIWVVSCTDCSEYDQVVGFNVCSVADYRCRR